MSGSVEDRIAELEVRYAFLEDTLQKLDGVLCEAMRTVETLGHEVNALRQQLNTASTRGDPLAEKPPHYGA